jgi:tRNA(Ile)-lysidine synthase
MIEQCKKALRPLLPAGDSLLVGVSGGADSVALLHALVKLGHRPHVCHLNHKLRGAASDGDAEFVRQLAQSYDLPCTIEDRNVTPDEDSCRQARREFFALVSERTGIHTLALAHTADDQVETFLLRLLRGAGVPGLVGIWPERQMGPVRVIRPLLGVRRVEILEYLKSEGLTWREDASNADTRFTRNRVRHELLPLLEREFNPAIRETLLRTAEILRDEDFYLTRHVAQTFYMAVCQNDAVNVKVLATCPVAVQRRLLRFWLGGEDERGPRFSFEQIEAVRQLALGESPSAEVALPEELVVYREYDWLRKAVGSQLSAFSGEWPVALEGETVVEELGVKFVAESARGISSRNSGEECFDADVIGETLTVRTWREGDRFQPLGMTGEKKLQDFFVDEKVPRRRRDRVPVLCAADGRIAWVVGCRMAEPFKVTKLTRRVLCVRVERIQG